MNTKPELALAIALILALGTVTLPAPVLAHGIAVDGNPADWAMAAPTNANTGHVGRLAGTPAPGQYVWTDLPGDERTEFASPDPGVDLVEFRVTGDASNLYIMARMTDVDVVAGDGAPQVQVAVDVDRDGSGSLSFGDGDTQVDPAAGWEYLLVTCFGSGGADVVVWTEGFASSSHVGAAVVDAGTDCVEVSVPWASLGGGPPSSPWRFTVATFRADASDDVWDVGGAGVSDALDCVTNYGNPGFLITTVTEVSDQVVNYHLDLYFSPGSGEVTSPLLVTEVFYDVPGAEPYEEWVQIYNAWHGSVSLDDWKVGDEETPDGGETMRRFPDGHDLVAGASIVVARRADSFNALGYSCAPDFEIASTDASVPDLIGYSLWASGGWSLTDGGDEVLLLDPCDTAVDVVTYEGGSYPGVVPHPGVSGGNSIQRVHANADTNDCGLDFAPAGGNGSPCRNTTAVELTELAASPRGPGLGMPVALSLAVALSASACLTLHRRHWQDAASRNTATGYGT